MKQGWTLDINPVYYDPDPIFDGLMTHHFPSELKHCRVAFRLGSEEVLVFYAVRPDPPYDEDNPEFFMSFRTILDDIKNEHANPLQQLMADAELGRKVREAGLELK